MLGALVGDRFGIGGLLFNPQTWNTVSAGANAMGQLSILVGGKIDQ